MDNRSDIRKFIEKWNVDFPIDRWWRKKHNIPFNSEEHRGHSLLDMRIEYEEDVMYNEIHSVSLNKTYDPGRGEWLAKRKPKEDSKAVIDHAFENIDLSNITI